MSTRNEKRLMVLSNKRARFRERMERASKDHKPVRALQAKLIDATTEQLRTEIRLERRRA